VEAEKPQPLDPKIYFTVRMPQSIRDRLDRAAKEGHRSTAAEVLYAVEKHLAEVEQPA
jgi:predicted DNA-binding protein